MKTRLLFWCPRTFPTLALLTMVSAVAVAGCDSGGSDACEADPCACGPCVGLPSINTVDTEPAWSPDGRTLAYTHLPQTEAERERGPLHLWLLDVETGERQFLTPGFLPDWSPDGNRLAYVLAGDIHTVEIATGEIVRLTEWGNCFHPSWSANGEWIVFDTSHDDPRGANVIWVMRADGSEKTDISEHGVGEWREPTWSPSEERILHIRYVSEEENPAPELFLMRSDGTEPIRLTQSTRDDHSPAWSPDGQHIAWDSYGEGADPTSGIWVMDADGFDSRLLMRGGGFPTWSPDGSRLAYYAPLDDTTGVLWTVDADGSNPRPLTRLGDYLIP